MPKYKSHYKEIDKIKSCINFYNNNDFTQNECCDKFDITIATFRNYRNSNRLNDKSNTEEYKEKVYEESEDTIMNKSVFTVVENLKKSNPRKTEKNNKITEAVNKANQTYNSERYKQQTETEQKQRKKSKHKISDIDDFLGPILNFKMPD